MATWQKFEIQTSSSSYISNNNIELNILLLNTIKNNLQNRIKTYNNQIYVGNGMDRSVIFNYGSPQTRCYYA